MQALDEGLREHQVAALRMVDGVLQDCQAVGTSAVVALQADMRAFMCEVILRSPPPDTTAAGTRAAIPV